MRFFLAGVLLVGLSGVPAIASQDPAQASRMELVAVVGCVAQNGNQWFVTNATGPLAAPGPDGPTGQTVTVDMARAEDVGTQRYRLIGVVDEYDVPVHEGHRVLARGLLIEDGDETRLNVTAVLMVEEDCP